MHVEHEQPFYQISNLPTYQLRCELFEYNDEDFDTDIAAIDDIERDYAYQYILNLDSAGDGFTIGETINQTLSSGVVMSGEVSHWSDSDNVLKLIHVGADDGKFHSFVPDLLVIGTTNLDSADAPIPIYSKATVASVGDEVNQISSNEQNTDFDGVDFLDFSESNPFGDPS
jgi:hypothetical protein